MDISKTHMDINNKFEVIFSNLPGLYLILEPDHTVACASKGFLECMGIPESLIQRAHITDIYKNIDSSISAAHISTLSHSIDTALNEKIPDIIKMDFRVESDCSSMPPGKRFWKVTNTLITEGESMDYILHSLEDITDKIIHEREMLIKNDRLQLITKKNKEASMALQESNQRLKLVTDMLPALIGYIGKDRRYKFVNEAYLQTLNITRDDIIGKNVDEFIADFTINDISQHINSALKGRMQNFEILSNADVDNPKYYEAMYLPDIDKDGEVRGFVSMIMEVTNKVKYYEELSKLASEREKLIEQKDEFIEMASHELKTPLTTIKAYVELILLDMDNLDKASISEYLKKTNGYITQLNRLISSLLDVGATNSGRLPYDFDYFAVGDLIDPCRSQVEEIEGAPMLDVECDVENEIYGDKQRIIQVLQCLLSNAIKYSEDNDSVMLSITENPNQVLFKVEDNGIGIPENELPHIFKRFSRAHALSYRNSGLGLGLYLSKEIISRHGGEIWAESEKGKGSSFYFSLPKKNKIITSYNQV